MSSESDRTGGQDPEDALLTLTCDGEDRSLHVNQKKFTENFKKYDKVTCFPGHKIIFDPDIVAFKALQMLVNYMEGHEMKLSIDNIEALLIAADYLKYKAALDKAIEFLLEDVAKEMRKMEEISMSRLLMYLRLYDLYRRWLPKEYKFKQVNMEGKTAKYTWKAHLTNVLTTHMKRIMYHPLFLELDFSDTKNLLNFDYLRLNEEEVLQAAKMWVRHDIENRMTHYPDLLSCVRIDNTITVQLITDSLVCHCNKVDCGCLPCPSVATKLLDVLVEKAQGRNLGQPLLKERNKFL